jgi:hypothetical protein
MKLTVQQWMNGSEEPRLPYPLYGDITIGLVTYHEKDSMFKVHMGDEYPRTYDVSADRILSGGG